MVTLRPHHGLCIRHFAGKGYSPAFVKRMAEVIEELRRNPGQPIFLRSGADVLCAACPHRREEGCASGQKPVDYDATCLKLCGLKEGAVLSWEAYAKRVEEAVIAPGRLEEVCKGCQWIALCR
ncbi:DUF1284 domain-containing protein [Zongyangia hominis]|uniref:DUF1284 domain-containing protein n=1 Tax=Zongyangia hominis TaxID=2763677 RepID=A0A926E9D2_9FIRM|nr:DUF1284 domain-containing protein [Zongyangia hominis]MBC8570320.1 DUF1284 domain-containing protein [Zongyangia hominis]